MFLGKHQPMGGCVDNTPMYQGMAEGAMGMPDGSGYAVGGYCGPCETVHVGHSEYDMPNFCPPRPQEAEVGFDLETCHRQKTYIVKKGDTVYKIAQKYGLDWRELARYNHLPNPDLIYPGQCLVIPAW